MTRHSEKKIAARAKFRDKLLESSNPVVAFLTQMAMFFKIKMWAFIEWITAALRKMGVRWKKYEWFTGKCAAGSKEGNKEGRDDHRSRTDPDVDSVCDTSLHNAG